MLCLDEGCEQIGCCQDNDNDDDGVVHHCGDSDYDHDDYRKQSILGDIPSFYTDQTFNPTQPLPINFSFSVQ